MNSTNNIRCPSCNSEEFVTMPNCYDILKFINGTFEVEKSVFTDEAQRIFCRECGNEIDDKTSAENKRIVLKVPND